MDWQTGLLYPSLLLLRLFWRKGLTIVSQRKRSGMQEEHRYWSEKEIQELPEGELGAVRALIKPAFFFSFLLVFSCFLLSLLAWFWLVVLRKQAFESLFTHHFQQLYFPFSLNPPINSLSSLNSHTHLFSCFLHPLKLSNLCCHCRGLYIISSVRLYLFEISDPSLLVHVHISQAVCHVALHMVDIQKGLERMNWV